MNGEKHDEFKICEKDFEQNTYEKKIRGKSKSSWEYIICLIILQLHMQSAHTHTRDIHPYALGNNVLLCPLGSNSL